MSATTDTPAPRGAGSTATSRSPRALWRASRKPIAFLGVLMVLAVVLALSAQRPPEGVLEPEGPNPEGARALVRVLQDRGSDVTVARDTPEAVAAADDGAVMVVADSRPLGEPDLRRLSRAPGDRLLVMPNEPTLRALAPGITRSGSADARTLAPRCDLSAARAAGDADTGGHAYDVGSGTGCYPVRDGATLVRSERDGRATTVLGDRAPLTNQRLAGEGNASLALNLIGERDVVWLLPDPSRTQGRESLWDLLPPSFHLALVPLTATLVLLALWRGRRLGPLVAERLPVVVRASETTEGRARLYAARRARDRAAAALRAGFLGRTRPALGLGPDTPPEAVVAAVAARTGDDPVTLRALLYRPRDPDETDGFAVDDRALVRLADELDRLGERLR